MQLISLNIADNPVSYQRGQHINFVLQLLNESPQLLPLSFFGEVVHLYLIELLRRHVEEFSLLHNIARLLNDTI